MIMDMSIKHLSDEELKNYEDRIVKMRDRDSLLFKIIAQRLGISSVRVSKYYKSAKRRMTCPEK